MNEPQKIYLKDYTPPIFCCESIDLDIRLYDDFAQVESTLTLKRQAAGELVLFGLDLQLEQITMNGTPLDKDSYTIDKEKLTIHHAPDAVVLNTRVRITPQTNTTLEGLYQAGSGDELMFVTQCEPEGFRKITYFPDRPDVLAVYTTRLEAPRTLPTLLANGNLVETGQVGDDRHYAIWHDPTKKPSYLFACVFADLQVLTDSYTTSENREVLLEIYAAARDLDKCQVAMQALKDSMRWDEQNYGRAYDLDRYMIVATGQFNMGAMENKGLNIFNTAYVLSSPKTATDDRNSQVKSVIAHEYFHNWTGNRITCRDWFQLCLKEGFTVFRDQSFSADFRSKAVQRIEDVAVLRTHQFAEDAGSLAHPVRPESFVEINNFYTATIYEKGAEIVRMIANLLGKEKFRQGTDEYFRRYDGQAVTVEDFLSALAVADRRVLDFLAWYRQPATPVLSGFSAFDQGKLTVTLTQKTRHVAGYDAPVALPIPVQTAAFDATTGEMLAQKLLLLTDWHGEFVFENIHTCDGKPPLVSVLRGFSAPVDLRFEYSDADLAKLVAFENDGFNQWQAMQTLFERYLTGGSDDDALIVRALDAAIDALMGVDEMLAAKLLEVPSEKQLALAYDSDYQPSQVRARRDGLIQKIADGLADKLGGWYQSLPMQSYEDTPRAMGRRALANTLLNLANIAGVPEAADWAVRQYREAVCMSEQLGAFRVIVNHHLPQKSDFVQRFYDEFADEDLVIDSWFSVLAADKNASVADIAALMARKDYDWQTPNRVRTTLTSLTARPADLWSEAGLELYVSAVARLDATNPLLAARLLSALARWHTLAQPLQAMAQAKLQTLQATATSKNVKEVLQNLQQDTSDAKE